MGRIDEIVTKVLSKLGEEGQRKVNRSMVISYMNDAQREIAERALALEGKKKIHLLSGKAAYKVIPPICKILQIQEPSSWRHRITVIHDNNEWVDKLKGHYVSSTPLFAHSWVDEIEFFPVPSAVDDLTLRVAMYPDPNVDTNEDPKLPKEWDKCIRYYVLNEVAGGEWTAKYENELGEQSHRRIKGITSGPSVTESRYDIGF